MQLWQEQKIRVRNDSHYSIQAALAGKQREVVPSLPGAHAYHQHSH